MDAEQIFDSMVYTNKKENLNSHFHNMHEFIYITSGQVNIKIDEKESVVGAGSIIFLNKFEWHSIRIIETPYERYYGMLSPAAMDRKIRDVRLLSVFKNRPAQFAHILDTGPLALRIEEYCRRIWEEYSGSKQCKEEIMSCNLYLMLVELYQEFQSFFPYSPSPVANQILEMQSYIDLNFKEDIRIEKLAETFFVNPFYASHMFKKMVGLSPKQYLINCRMSYAKDILIHEHCTVAETAYCSGFRDVNNFIKCFKKHFNMTPNQYRKHYM